MGTKVFGKIKTKSNLVGCVFFALKAHQLSLLNKFDWKKVEFYSAVVTTIILAVCALSTFILSVSWKGKSRGYGSLVSAGFFTSLATVAKGAYIKFSTTSFESDDFDTV